MPKWVKGVIAVALLPWSTVWLASPVRVAPRVPSVWKVTVC